MSRVNVIIVHETDGYRYFEAIVNLEASGQIEGLEVYDSSVVRRFLRSLLRERKGFRASFDRALRNLKFRASIFKIEGRVIILGVAPWDFRFLLYSTLRAKNDLIYHTSWCDWSESFVPRRYLFLTPYLRRAWLKCLSSKSLRAVAVTDVSAESLLKQVPNVEVSVIPHVVSAAFSSLEARVPDVQFRIIFVGDLIEQKGVVLLPALMALLPWNCTLTIVGDGPYRRMIEEFAASDGRVEYLGWIGDRGRLAEVFSEHHAIVLPSLRNGRWQELLGMVLIEAMTTGVVPIASNHAGPRSVISDEVTGYLVDEGDLHSIVNRIDRLISDIGVWRQMSTAARREAQQYQMKEISQRWHSTLESGAK